MGSSAVVGSDTDRPASGVRTQAERTLTHAGDSPWTCDGYPVEAESGLSMIVNNVTLE